MQLNIVQPLVQKAQISPIIENASDESFINHNFLQYKNSASPLQVSSTVEVNKNSTVQLICALHIVVNCTILGFQCTSTSNDSMIWDLFLVMVACNFSILVTPVWSATAVLSKEIIALSFLYYIGRAFICIYHYGDPRYVDAYVLVLIATGIGFSTVQSLLIFTSQRIHHELILKPEELNHNTTYKTRLDGIEILRFLSSLHIVVFHFYQSNGSEIWQNFASWGGSQLTFFFMTSGFVLSYQYFESTNDIKTTDFWFKRFAKLYPSYIISIIIMCCLISPQLIDPSVLIALISCTNSWLGFAFTNPINEPGWTVGSFFFLYLIFQAVLKIMKATTNLSTQLHNLAWFLLVALVAGFVQNGYVLGQPFYPLLELVFKSHLQEFMFGIVLGAIYLQAKKVEMDEQSMEDIQLKRVVSILNKFGLSGGLIVLLVLFFSNNVKNALIQSLISNGILLPIYAILVWGASSGEDCFFRTLLSSHLMIYLGRISYGIYILQTVVYQIMLQMGTTDYFIPFLIIFAGVTYHMIEVPCSTFLVATCRESFTDFFVYVESTIFWVANLPSSERFLTFFYYLSMITIIGGYCYILISNCEGYAELATIEFTSWYGYLIFALKWFIIIGIPAAVTTVMGQVGWCPWKRVKTLSNDELTLKLRNKLYFRIVTRGLNPNLVRENAWQAYLVLDSCLPRDKYKVEVVTDNKIDIAHYFETKARMDTTVDHSVGLSAENVMEVVVPSAYKCPSGARFKARALHYAILNSTAAEKDWIVHLDEETQFNVDTVRYILHHCIQEDEAVRDKVKSYGNIGQGVILYGTKKVIENYVTTLADSIRVGDDFGKFRLQYETHYPWIGMHGSFVVCSNAVEKLIGFDNGMKGSITEDAYFALVAWEKGIQFSWIDAYMFEQSPFTIMDFIQQRRRWFGGLFLVCRDERISVKYRGVLLILVITWAFSSIPLLMVSSGIFVTIHNVSTGWSDAIRYLVTIFSAVTCWSYMLGFVKTFDIRDGIMRYFVLFFIQLTLLFFYSLMEITGVIAALINPPYESFHIVKKEGKEVLSTMAAVESSNDLLVSA